MIKKRNNVKKAAFCLALGCLCSLGMTTPVLAVDASGALQSMNTFRDFLGQVISLIGTFYLLWGVFEFANSLMGNDGIMQASAFKKIAAGFLCMAAPDIYSLLRG
ncbi:MAG: hypothetical protein MSA72_19160 [Lachnospiraceae bacterium]|nr:hypothetical protein [Lachnospiraceae bacterium]